MLAPALAPRAPEPPPAGRAEAAAVVWDWSGERRRTAEAAATRAHRVRGVATGAVGLAVSAFLFWRGAPVAGSVVGGLALAGLALSLLLPPGGVRRMQAGLLAAGHAVGRATTLLVMTPLFVLFFVPFGVLLRRGVRDPLRRRFEPRAATYWRERGPLAPHDRPF